MRTSLLFILTATVMPTAYDAHARVKQSYTFSGTIKNSETGEVLIGATVIVRELKDVGASSNAYGFYSITLPEGTYAVNIQYLGFKTKLDTIVLDRDRTINFSLAPQPITESEVVVSGEHSNANVVSTNTSSNNLQVQQVKAIPVILGEQDILKTIQFLPGIEAAGEGSTAFYARGGSADQNLIVLDEAPVYNPSHLLGFLSVFNSDAINDVTVITGGMPAEYGGRLSSVVDIRTNDGNDKKFGATGGIGLLDSRLTVDGPIIKDQGSFIISGRRTYADLFLRLSKDTTINRVRLYFYDLNAKVNYTLGDKDRVFLSGYFGRDNFNYPDIFGFNWGNATATLRWNHVFGDKFFSNTSLIYSDYEYTNDVGLGTNQFEITSGIQDANFKTDFQYFMTSGNTISFGLNSIYHTFFPGAITSSSTSSVNSLSLEHKYALENAAYISHQIGILSDLNLDYGLRVSSFTLLGPGTVYTYNDLGDIMDTAAYGSGKSIKTYVSLEPRIALTYILDQENSIKSSYDRTVQYLHLLSNSTSTNPSDLWVPSTNNVPPEYADQVDIGYFKNFDNNQYESSLVLYYKLMRNLIDYRNGADLQLNPVVESLLLYGTGWSYGAELLVKKKIGPIAGWLSYTLSRTEEKFAQINNGNPFPATQDRTHAFSAVVTYDLNDTWTFGATWVYYAGNAVTFPSGNYMIDGRLVPYYTSKNGYRMPAYNRLDLSATWTINQHSNLNFSIYNAYNRQNAYSITFRQNPDNPNETQAVQTTIFPIMPSITYNFNF
ncbi:MAG TPA: TonB-dependent receptor [Candidatus Acidoferrales bacterium]|nr:TonB-dependent receptor [Candidatus Acidoferrales bacterium]